MITSLLMLLTLTTQTPSDARAEAERLARAGSHEEALARFHEVVRIDPRDLESRIWIGRLYSWMGHPEKAEPVFRSVLASMPDNTEALVGLGTALANQNRLDEAAPLLKRAEEITPDSADVLAAQGRVHRLEGDTAMALAYYLRAAELNPADLDIRAGLEQVRLLRDHRVEVTGYGETFSLPVSDTRSGDISINMRLSERLRAFARGQTQRKFDTTDSRGGGGVEWRSLRNVTFRGHILYGPDAEVFPRADVNGEIGWLRGRAELFAGVRYLHFRTANAWVVAPGLMFWVNDGLAVGGRYYRSETVFADREGHVGNDSAALRLLFRLKPRIWLSGGYASGNETFETFSVDRLGHFRADTGSAGVRIDFETLTSLAANYEYQLRGDATSMTRVTIVLSQRF